MVFGDTGRGPDEALKLMFEAIRQFSADERKIAEGVLDSLIVQHQAKRLFAPAAATVARGATNAKAATSAKRSAGR